MNPAELFGAGFGVGVVATMLFLLTYRGRSDRDVCDPSDPGALVMAIRADMQAQLDRLSAVPAAISASQAAAVAAAEATAAQDHTDEVAAVTQATDAIVTALQPAPALNGGV